MTTIRYPPAPENGESKASWEARLRAWRMEEKTRLLIERGHLCERGCGRQSAQLDEAIIPRCDQRGFSLEQKRIAFASCGLALLCAHCNCEEAHDREGAWDRAVARYGLEVMQSWYESLELRAPDRRFIS